MLRLRQICLVADKLAPAVREFEDTLALKTCFHDPAVGKFGLENALFPIGHNFLEIVAPIEPNTTAERYLKRRKGNGGYMVILQCNDAERRRARMPEIDVRFAHLMDYGDFLGTQLHPKDTGGCMLEVDRQDGDVIDGPWHPAGTDWLHAISQERVTAMTGAELQSEDPEKLGARWADILERPISKQGDGYEVPLDNAVLRFVPLQDDRGEGLIGIDLQSATDGDETLSLCGISCRLRGS